MKGSRAETCVFLATTFALLIGLGLDLYVFAQYVMGAPVSFDIATGLLFLTSTLVLTHSLNMILYARKTESQRKVDVRPEPFLSVLATFFVLLAVVFHSTLSYPLARVLLYLIVFNTASLPLSYKL